MYVRHMRMCACRGSCGGGRGEKETAEIEIFNIGVSRVINFYRGTRFMRSPSTRDILQIAAAALVAARENCSALCGRVHALFSVFPVLRITTVPRTMQFYQTSDEYAAFRCDKFYCRVCVLHVHYHTHVGVYIYVYTLPYVRYTVSLIKIRIVSPFSSLILMPLAILFRDDPLRIV